MRTILLALLFVALPALAQQGGVYLNVGPGGAAMQIQPGAMMGDGSYQLAYLQSNDGATLLKALAPDGRRIRIFEGPHFVAEGSAPLILASLPGRVYRVLVQNPDGSTWERRVETQPGMVATLSIGMGPALVAAPPPPQYPPQGFAPPPPGPMPMAPGDFDRLAQAISAEGFPENKLAVLRTAAQSAAFSCDQVGRLIDLYAFPNDKVKVVAITKGEIVDPQDAYTLYGHFAFPGDKDRVRQILGN
ncbi:MAG: DUF4476 domain-containing protein [Deltaproteobacteria bacterium]